MFMFAFTKLSAFVFVIAFGLLFGYEAGRDGDEKFYNTAAAVLCIATACMVFGNLVLL